MILFNKITVFFELEREWVVNKVACLPTCRNQFCFQHSGGQMLPIRWCTNNGICWLVGSNGICKLRSFQKLSCPWRRHSKAANYEKADDPLSWKVFERLGASLFPVSSLCRGFTCIQDSRRQFKKLIKLLFPPSSPPCGDIIAGDRSSSPKSFWSIFRNISRYFAIYQSPPAHPLQRSREIFFLEEILFAVSKPIPSSGPWSYPGPR